MNQDQQNPGGAQSVPDQDAQKEELCAGKSEEECREIFLPKVDFATFILSMASSALVQLGEVPNPETGKSEENLKLAKHSIDIIQMLQDKIQNGLSEEETRLLEGILYELRLKYVIKAK